MTDNQHHHGPRVAAWIERDRDATRSPHLTAEQAEAAGYTIDRHCYPWVAYKGPRFGATHTRDVITPSWPPPPLLEWRVVPAGDGLPAALYATRHGLGSVSVALNPDQLRDMVHGWHYLADIVRQMTEALGA